MSLKEQNSSFQKNHRKQKKSNLGLVAPRMDTPSPSRWPRKEPGGSAGTPCASEMCMKIWRRGEGPDVAVGTPGWLGLGGGHQLTARFRGDPQRPVGARMNLESCPGELVDLVNHTPRSSRDPRGGRNKATRIRGPDLGNSGLFSPKKLNPSTVLGDWKSGVNGQEKTTMVSERHKHILTVS